MGILREYITNAEEVLEPRLGAAGMIAGIGSFVTGWVMSNIELHTPFPEVSTIAEAAGATTFFISSALFFHGARRSNVLGRPGDEQ